MRRTILVNKSCDGYIYEHNNEKLVENVLDGTAKKAENLFS